MCDLMYSCRGLDTMRESMPQTVPSAGFTPPSEYLHFAADYFDLSLLPSSPDLDLPPSPFSLLQGMSFYGDPANSPPSSLFGAQSQTQDDFKNQQQELQRPPVSVSNFHFVSPSTSTVIKEEPQSFRDTSCGFSSSGSPYPSMSQMTSPSPFEHMSHVSAASPMPCSPAGSTSSSSTSYQRCPTPHSIKHEQTIDLAHILSEHQVLQENVKEEGFRSPAKDRPGTSGRAQEIPSGSMFECITQVGGNGHVQQHKPYADESAGSGSDHKLLREFLRDPSFQKKYNLRPFEFAGLGSGFVVAEAGASSSAATDEKLEGEDLQLSREKMEPVLRLAIQQLRKDVGDTCTQLGIAPDPTRWSSRDVEAWILWALHHYALPMINMEYFEMDGSALSALSEQDFQQRAPLCGSTLYAHLEIWKAACQDLDAGTSSATWNSSTSNSSTGDSSDDEDDETESAAAASPSVGTTSSGKMLSNRSSGGGGSHIHLWQFLKELLASPQLHGSCIRWLDRSKGVFKIEDSVRVARLWGKRKNRPAMNYDKLSRSIRQYYKKGIMKKTERSQRLVYQFCHPYCL